MATVMMAMETVTAVAMEKVTAAATVTAMAAATAMLTGMAVVTMAQRRNNQLQGGRDGGSRSVRQWAGRVAAVQCIFLSYFFNPSPSMTLNAEATDVTAAVISYTGPYS